MKERKGYVRKGINSEEEGRGIRRRKEKDGRGKSREQ